MPMTSPLGSEAIIAFVGTKDAATAKSFYHDTLGLRLISEDEFALAFDVNGSMLRVANVGKVVLAPYTVLGWQVKNLSSTVKALLKAGVKFERYPGMDQDVSLRNLRREVLGIVGRSYVRKKAKRPAKLI